MAEFWGQGYLISLRTAVGPIDITKSLKKVYGIRGQFRAYRFKVEVYYSQIRATKFLVSLASLLSCPVTCHVNKCYYCIVRFIRNFSLPFLLLGDVLRGHLQHGQTYPS